MDQIMLELQPRDITGKAVKRLRAEGLVPAVIHDHGKASVHVMGDYLPLLKAYQAAGKNHPVQVKAGDKRFTALIKTVDVDPKKHQLRHVVFNAVKANEKVTAEVPVRVQYDEGNDASPAERASLVVLHQLEVVEVEAVPSKLPDALFFNGEVLKEVGDHVTVGDLIVPEGVILKTDPTHPLATVFEPSALAAANDAAGGDATEDEATADVDAGEAAAGLAAEKAAEQSEKSKAETQQ
ncbi:MAG TPA: 50S ribosomal protein L25 [Candidatus Saccharimonadales bacterium]|nr:50S ribosomal protein L25 [Candidatus Saccharimonadales bacterium]